MTRRIVVVGGGHAGCEAAAVAARMGCDVVLITHDPIAIGRLSCNPAIGGLAKGHLVKELDALGGLMAKVADASTVQFRHLNTRKGLAVRSSRAQVDVDLYPALMQAQLGHMEGLSIVGGEVVALRWSGRRVIGVALRDGTEVSADAVILTTGTFLGGIMHRGQHQEAGGRLGDAPALELAADLRERGLSVFRLKTGTVPRLHRDTIAWRTLPAQEDIVPDGRFSLSPPASRPKPLTCHVTYTNAHTHDLVRSHLNDSPLYTGAIVGRGPRYCPSIEDKVVRFAERERHLVHLEPEGHGTPRVYVNGLSTSLPEDVQLAMVRSLEGCENADVLQYGYAVEYDVSDPRDLDMGLQHREMPGLFLAGQINGTSGYEEAAVQGFVAGVNAARDEEEPWVLGRAEAYIGVLVDDLVHRGVGGEPYRMFTSRAEHRLLLREDNSDTRLLPHGRALGLVTDEVWEAHQRRRSRVDAVMARSDELVRPTAAVRARCADVGIEPLQKQTTLGSLLRRPDITWAQVQALVPDLPDVPAEDVEPLVSEIRYMPYVERAQERARRLSRFDHVRLPEDMDWLGLSSLSMEVRERLHEARPETLGAASRLPGITPAALSVVAAWLQQRAPDAADDGAYRSRNR